MRISQVCTVTHGKSRKNYIILIETLNAEVAKNRYRSKIVKEKQMIKKKFQLHSQSYTKFMMQLWGYILINTKGDKTEMQFNRK